MTEHDSSTVPATVLKMRQASRGLISQESESADFAN